MLSVPENCILAIFRTLYAKLRVCFMQLSLEFIFLNNSMENVAGCIEWNTITGSHGCHPKRKVGPWEDQVFFAPIDEPCEHLDIYYWCFLMCMNLWLCFCWKTCSCPTIQLYRYDAESPIPTLVLRDLKEKKRKERKSLI